MLHVVACLAAAATLAAGDPGSNASRAVPEPENPLADVARQSHWIETVPLPPSTSLPLAGETGVDRDGYPRQYVDRPALRSLLLHRRFEDLTRALETFQSAFERDPHYEVWVAEAWNSLGMAHPRELELIDAWAAATPRSFAPHLARALHWKGMGFLLRGWRFTMDTSSSEFARMEEAFAQAEREAHEALALRPRLMNARNLLASVAVARGERAEARRWIDEGLRDCPSCYEFRVWWLTWPLLLPQWGGSPEQAAAFVRSRSDPRTPRHRWLEGYVDLARVYGSKSQPQRLAALERACARGKDYRFYRQRGVLRGSMGDAEGWLADLDRANTIRPGITSVLFNRAQALAQAERWEEAGRDLLYAFRSEPTSSGWSDLQLHVARALDALAWKAHQADREGDARRLYDLAQALFPGDASIAARSAQVRQGAAAGAAAGPPATGSARPEILLTVTDQAGNPVVGALAIVGHGTGMGAQHLIQAARDQDGAFRTDAAGRVRISDKVEPVTLLAFDPGGIHRAAGVVEVEAVGAELQLKLGGDRRLEGQVIGPARQPVPGVVVWAIPDTRQLGPEARSLGSAVSDAEGRFAVGSLDGGRYRLFASGNGFFGSPSGEEATGASTTVTVQKKRLLRGRVLVSRPGVAPTFPERAVLQGLPFGKRELLLREGRFAAEFDMPWAPTPVSFTVEGLPEVILRLELLKEVNQAGDVLVGPGRVVRGVVRDPRGLPAAGTAITSETGTALGQASEQGTFKVKVQEGPLQLEFKHARWLPLSRPVGGEEQEIAVQLASGPALKVLAQRGDGSPMVGSWVLSGATT